MYIELHVVKWLKPLYNSAHVKKEKTEIKKKQTTKKTTMSRHPQRETKGFKPHRAPPSVQALTGGRLDNTAQLSSAQLGSAQLGLALT